MPAVSSSKSSSSIAVEFWQPLASHQGTGVISSSSRKTNRDLCLVCGSAGGQDRLVYCAGCCQSVHVFCLPSPPEGDTWLCDTCVRCRVCGGRDTSNRCAECGHVYHDTCLPLSLRNNETDTSTWRCGTRRTCPGCGNGSSPLVHGGQLCSSCCQARAQGGFCPLCRGCYQEDDYDQAMMECSSCGG